MSLGSRGRVELDLGEPSGLALRPGYDFPEWLAGLRFISGKP